jgi:hypothetical protein
MSFAHLRSIVHLCVCFCPPPPPPPHTHTRNACTTQVLLQGNHSWFDPNNLIQYEQNDFQIVNHSPNEICNVTLTVRAFVAFEERKRGEGGKALDLNLGWPHFQTQTGRRRWRRPLSARASTAPTTSRSPTRRACGALTSSLPCTCEWGSGLCGAFQSGWRT